MAVPSTCKFVTHCSISFLLWCALYSLPIIVQPLSFTIVNFSDTESASIVGYTGDAKNENGSIVLNTFTGNGVGRAIYGQPMHLKDSSKGLEAFFSTSFSFTIYRSSNTSYADGFAFYLIPVGYELPPDSDSGGGNLGLFNGVTAKGVPQNHVVAVEFDTWINEFDPPMKHIGINNNSIISIKTVFFDIDSNIGKIAHALITYDASTKILAVSCSFNGSSKPNAFVSQKIDLAEILPADWVTIGFSGSIGRVSEQNVIHSWEFTSTLHSTYNDSEVVNTENNNYVKYHFELKVVVAVVVTCLITFTLLVVSFSWLLIKRKRTKGDENDVDLRHTSVALDLDRAGIARRFDYSELVAATNGFSNDRRLGEGGSGQVYKGIQSDLEGRVVAVKRIFANFENSERIFINEVKIISRLMHRNLVRFNGWCHEQGEFLLVFEYLPNGSLDTHLFGNRKTLAWDLRYKIVLGMATAIHYLHEDAEQCVLHRDIKSANVLLDTDFCTKLSDFGIAKLVDRRLRTQKTGLAGTYGYMAPEYINSGKASKKSDIYSFGVVALEIACGRKTYLQADEEYHLPLPDWVWQQYVEGNILNVVDERLNGIFDVHEMTCLLIVGLWCTQINVNERPKAEQIIKVLKLELPLPVLPHDMHNCTPSSTNEQFGSFQIAPITSSLENVGR